MASMIQLNLKDIKISDDYLWTLGGLLVMGLQYVAIGQMVDIKRRQLFSKSFLEKHFGAEHKKATGQEIQEGGYPDTGEGRYSKKLTEDQWLELKNA
jgi:uncharacterized membrane protein YecN with MAPEG domain